MPPQRQKPTSQRVLSFLDLPLEVRDQIYAHLLPSQSSITPVGTLSRYAEIGDGDYRPDGGYLPIPDYPSGFFHTGPFSPHKPQLPLHLLLINKQIHTEYASHLFGSFQFNFILGMLNSTILPVASGNRPQGTAPTDQRAAFFFNNYKMRPKYLLDNLSDIPTRHLRLVRNASLWLWLPVFISHARNEELYLHCATQIQSFAARFGGNLHSLGTFNVKFNTPRPPVSGLWGHGNHEDTEGRERPRCCRGRYHLQLLNLESGEAGDMVRMENMLAPLGAVYGVEGARVVPAQVVGNGGELDGGSELGRGFVESLEGAMRSGVLRCWPLEQVMRKKVVKRKGRRCVQEYRAGRWFDSKFWFEVDE